MCKVELNEEEEVSTKGHNLLTCSGLRRWWRRCDPRCSVIPPLAWGRRITSPKIPLCEIPLDSFQNKKRRFSLVPAKSCKFFGPPRHISHRFRLEFEAAAGPFGETLGKSNADVADNATSIMCNCLTRSISEK